MDWKKINLCKLMQPEKKKGAEKGTHNTGNPRRLQRSKRD